MPAILFTVIIYGIIPRCVRKIPFAVKFYGIPHMLYGFVAGTYASNYDVSHVFIDSALKICNNDMHEFVKFVKTVDSMCAEHNIELVMTSSIPVEEVPEEIKSFVC